jgi:hypothetical protein
MSANTSPVFPYQNAGFGPGALTLTAAGGSARDGTGATTLLHTVASARGDIIRGVWVSLSEGVSAATVIRFWKNNGSAPTTATNNIFLPQGEKSIPTFTAVNNAQAPVFYIPLNIHLKLNERLYAGLGTVITGGVRVFVDAVSQDA